MDHDAQLEALREHVDARLAAQDQKLDELLAILRASKVGVAIIKWLAGFAAAVVTGWAAWEGIR
mgnify:FL=1